MFAVPYSENARRCERWGEDICTLGGPCIMKPYVWEEPMNLEPGRQLNLNQPYGLVVERLNGAEALIAPTANWWETGVTFNAAAVYLEPTLANAPVLRALLPMRAADDPALAHGVVAIHYRARPENDPGSAFGRSFIGLALFTPELELLYRYQEPVLYPTADVDGLDHYGVEDPRITRLGDTFYMVYCGVQPDAQNVWRANLCLATSPDLLHWQKHGLIRGDPAIHFNKDGVLFPEQVDGQYLLLHRPFTPGLDPSTHVIRLAQSATLDGPWVDVGELMRAFPNPRMHASWLGAGSVPLRLAEKRYLVIYHTGNLLNAVDREYDLDAAICDFNHFDPRQPETLVSARLEPLMVPETPAELRSHSQLQVGNVLFACGSYVYRDYLYIIYGGADTYTLAARVELAVLCAALEKCSRSNPFMP
jgi:beta-1,2-mannobiose phosphorylase / 1,2-beta-oligomannan phosphorylase